VPHAEVGGEKRPAPTSARVGARACGSDPRTCHAQAQSSGAASAVRQNALATGPVSANRTKIGANPIAQPPASKQRNAPVEMGAEWAVAVRGRSRGWSIEVLKRNPLTALRQRDPPFRRAPGALKPEYAQRYSLSALPSS
jgi:hypothetical protein